MKVFLLGATGLIGQAVTDRLLLDGYTVSALARSDTSAEKLRVKRVEVIVGDIATPKMWCECLSEFDAIIHMAAIFDDRMASVDDRLIREIILQTRKSSQTPRVIYTGGVWLYGNTEESVATEDTPYDCIPAFEWMIAGETQLRSASHLETLVIHPACVYGRNTGTFSEFIEAGRADERITLWGDKSARTPLVHADDLAEAYVRVLKFGQAGENYNVAAEEGVDALEIADAICAKFNSPRDHMIRTKQDLITAYGAWAEGPTLRQNMSSAKIQNELGWTARHKRFVAQI